jgi:phosphoglucosamine mutase
MSVSTNQHKRRYFGTDGIRGQANTPPMDAGTALRLGQAVGKFFNRGDHLHRVLIGKDTRLSGYMLEPALTSGFIGSGMDVTLVGPLPTPAISMLTRSLRCDIGVMISASHNPYQDNGIKLFGPDGLKLSDEQESAIENLMDDPHLSSSLVSADKLGRAQRLENAGGRYVEAVKASFPRGASLEGLRIALDCAHGASYKVAPQALWELGAEVVSIGMAPDGTNINKECGSTSPGALRAHVLERRADIGIALDGDADRILIIDERGQIIDGDQIIALISTEWHKHNKLTGNAVVSTVMSNLGLERYLNTLDVGLHRTKVGDRYVGEKMREAGCNIGGEQSGHIILSDYATTGDGLLAGLQVLSAMARQKAKASKVCNVFKPLPQFLVNVRYGGGGDPLALNEIKDAILDVEKELGISGRVLVRSSGTEPLIRIMVEAERENNAATSAEKLRQIISKTISTSH